MDILKKIFFKKKQKWPLFGSTKVELEGFFSDLGDATIHNNYIEIKKYPFEPSIAFTQERFESNMINEIYIDSTPPFLQINKDIVFISAEYRDELKIFAQNNFIKISQNSYNWDYILTPFLDTEYDEASKIAIKEKLNKNGIYEEEVAIIRNEVEEQMLKYNFDTMLWEWCSLDLLDVLSAMKVKYNKEEFEDFYYRAIEIELRRGKQE